MWQHCPCSHRQPTLPPELLQTAMPFLSTAMCRERWGGRARGRPEPTNLDLDLLSGPLNKKAWVKVRAGFLFSMNGLCEEEIPLRSRDQCESAVSLGDFVERALSYYAHLCRCFFLHYREAGNREQPGPQTLSVGWSVGMPLISALSRQRRKDL